MASTITGLLRPLAWNDFPVRQMNAPAPGQSATAAHTDTSFIFGGSMFQPIPGMRPARFRLVDSITISVTFTRNKSFVMSWVFSRPQQFQDDMLNHEQGHYNITALICRDFFVDVMLLKAQVFTTGQAGITSVRQIQQQSLEKIGNVQQLYDQEVHPEQNSGLSRGPIQQSWDRFIQAAFTQARSTGTQAPDGTPHKVRLIDVLTQNGKQV
jgi:hypothetical protein